MMGPYPPMMGPHPPMMGPRPPMVGPHPPMVGPPPADGRAALTDDRAASRMIGDLQSSFDPFPPITGSGSRFTRAGSRLMGADSRFTAAAPGSRRAGSRWVGGGSRWGAAAAGSWASLPDLPEADPRFTTPGTRAHGLDHGVLVEEDGTLRSRVP